MPAENESAPRPVPGPAASIPVPSRTARARIIISAALGLLIAAGIFLFVQYRATSASLAKETQLRESLQLRLGEQEQDLARKLAQINDLDNSLRASETKNGEFQTRVGVLEKDQALLQTQLETARDAQKKTEERLAEEQTTVADLQKKIDEDRGNQTKLLSHIERLMGEKTTLQEKLAALETGPGPGAAATMPEVVVSGAARARRTSEGAILAVNKRYDFVVFNLGEKDGVKTGSRWDVVEQGRTVGGVVARRVLPTMTVADVDARQTRSTLKKNAVVVPHE